MVLYCFLAVFMGKHSKSQPGLCMRSIDFSKTFTTVTYSKTIASHVNYTWKNLLYRPFPSCPKPLFQSEAKCEAIDMKMSFYFHAHKTHFHKKGFVLSFVLKVRAFGTQKWHIKPCFFICTYNIYINTCCNPNAIFFQDFQFKVNGRLSELRSLRKSSSLDVQRCFRK